MHGTCQHHVTKTRCSSVQLVTHLFLMLRTDNNFLPAPQVGPAFQAVLASFEVSFRHALQFGELQPSGKRHGTQPQLTVQAQFENPAHLYTCRPARRCHQQVGSCGPCSSSTAHTACMHAVSHKKGSNLDCRRLLPQHSWLCCHFWHGRMYEVCACRLISLIFGKAR